MKTLFTCLMGLGLAIGAKAQQNFPYSVDFNGGGGLPLGWQSSGPAWAPSWVVSSNMARIAELSGNVADVRLNSPALNTSSVPNPVVEYRMMIAPTDIDCTPELSIMYSTDGGQTLNLIVNIGTSDVCSSSGYVVNSHQWYWLYTPLPSFSNGLVIFEGDFPNNGYGTVYLDDVVFRDLNAVGVAEPTDVNFSVSPNPARDQVSIKGDLPPLASYMISDMTGRVLLTSTVPADGIIAVGALLPGCHVLSLRDETGGLLASQKLLKY